VSKSATAGQAPPELPGYQFLQHLGTGGNSQVYLYEQALPKRKVAVKVLNESGLTETARRRFTAEANVTAGLTHRHIVQVFEANVTADGRPYLVMPYYPQPNLSVRARRAHFSVAEVLRIGVQIGSAVETSHRNDVLHRDIKPQNILTDQYGEPALTDFGIATTKGGDGPEGLSVPWSPPEILYGTTAGDERSDVYSLGATLWHLLVGRSPFEQPGGDNAAFALMGRIKSDPPPRTGRADVPESLERLLRQAMAKDPDARPQTALDLIRGLQVIEQELRLPLTLRRGQGRAPSVLDATPPPRPTTRVPTPGHEPAAVEPPSCAASPARRRRRPIGRPHGRARIASTPGHPGPRRTRRPGHAVRVASPRGRLTAQVRGVGPAVPMT
jgi:serine/threonine protein kinase